MGSYFQIRVGGMDAEQANALGIHLERNFEGESYLNIMETTPPSPSQEPRPATLS